VQNLLSSSLLIKKIKNKIYRTIILAVVLYGCETWSRTLREDCRLREFENRVLRRIFGRNRNEVTGDWRNRHNEQLNGLNSSPSNVLAIKSRIRWARHVARMGDRRYAYGVLVGHLLERVHLEDPGVDGRIIVKWIFRKWNVGTWTGSIWPRK
jgi:hypothetical protein